VPKLEEATRSSVEIAATDLFMRMGLTDAGIGLISSKAMIVLTDDARLAAALVSKGVQAFSFDLLKSLSAM
jgi:uncharacterized protein YaiI (UPF0178 family)